EKKVIIDIRFLERITHAQVIFITQSRGKLVLAFSSKDPLHISEGHPSPERGDLRFLDLRWTPRNSAFLRLYLIASQKNHKTYDYHKNQLVQLHLEGSST